MSALPPKADLTPTPRHVGYVPKADIAPVNQLKNKEAAECGMGASMDRRAVLPCAEPSSPGWDAA